MSAAHRFRYTLVAGATAVVIGAGFTVVGLNRQAAPPAAKKPRVTPAKRKATTAAPAAKPKSDPATSGSIIAQVLDHINAARAEESLAPLTLDSNLSKAAALHNQLMSGDCGLEHQCPGEGGIGERFSAQGVQWSSAGENIGYGWAGATDAAIAGAANGLCDSMLAEVPPADGHRKNLLSKSFKRIGQSVVRESTGQVWLTQDFVG